MKSIINVTHIGAHLVEIIKEVEHHGVSWNISLNGVQLRSFNVTNNRLKEQTADAFARRVVKGLQAVV